jgi:hypothetical protein
MKKKKKSAMRGWPRIGRCQVHRVSLIIIQTCHNLSPWPNDVHPCPEGGTIGMEYLVVQLQKEEHASRCRWPVVSAARIPQIHGLVQFPPSGHHLPRVRRLMAHVCCRDPMVGPRNYESGWSINSSFSFLLVYCTMVWCSVQNATQPEHPIVIYLWPRYHHIVGP